MDALAPYVMSHEGAGGISVETSKEGLHVLARKLGHRAVILAANPGAGGIASFRVRGMPFTRATRLFETTPVEVDGQRMTTEMAAKGRAALLLE